MNVEQLKKNCWSKVHLRPIAIRRDEITNEMLQPLDDEWTTTSVDRGADGLQNTRTDSVVSLGNDNVREFRSPGFLLLRCQLTLWGNRVLIDPI